MQNRPWCTGFFLVIGLYTIFLCAWLNNFSGLIPVIRVNGLYNCSKAKERHYQDINSPRIALASFPGAGNTWTRHLIEQITGIYSGSVYYSDKRAVRLAFPGEKYSDGRVCVIKTHEIQHWNFLNFSKAIIIHRNLKDSMLANFNRVISGSNVLQADEDAFAYHWRNFVLNGKPGGILYKNSPEKYKKFYESWTLDFPGEKLILRYSDMVTDLYEQLVKIRYFLQANATDDELKCVVMNGEGSFHRKKKLPFNPWNLISDDVLREYERVENYVESFMKYN